MKNLSPAKSPDLSASPSQPLTIKYIMLISLWSGLATGLLEVSIQIFRKFGLDQMIGLGPDFIWMAPLADGLIFLAVGLLFVPYAWRFARVKDIRVLVFILAFLCAFVTLQYLPIHWLAMEILALGIAVACANSAMRFGDGFYRLVRTTSPALVVLVILSGIGLRAYLWNMERQAIANLPAAGPGLPNVLLIVMDTVRAENMSLYGYERNTTPVLNELSKQGVVYQNAFSTAPWTLPSHASLFTGQWPHDLSADWWLPLDETYPTLAEVLQGHGYLTAGFSGNLYYVTYEYGLDRGFIHFEDYDHSLGQIFMNSLIGRGITCNGQHGMGCFLRKISVFARILNYRKQAVDVNEATMAWVNDHPEQPYFIFINYIDPHERNITPRPFDTAFGPKQPPFSKVFLGDGPWDGTPEETQRELTSYDETILYVDHEIGSLLDQMGAQGLLENTLIIITSDHGEEFDEHAVFGHGKSLYRQSVQVPLLMVYGDHLPAGVRLPEQVSLRNIPATILDLAGLSASSPFPGYSLAGYLNGSGNLTAGMDESILTELTDSGLYPGLYPISKGDMKSIAFDGLRYILNGDEREELYDFELDPQEMNDLSGTPEGQAALPGIRLLLEGVLRDP